MYLTCFDGFIVLLKYCILMFFQVLQADGGNYCAAVNAATLALIDAGIPLKDYVTACTAGYINDRVLVDVNNTESRELLILR